MPLQQTIEQLAEVQQKYPKEFNEVIAEHPEWFNAIRDWKHEQELIQLAQQDTPEGFFAFYEGIHGMSPPPHVKDWVHSIYKAHNRGLGFTLNGFRGSWKSSSLSVDFLAFRISKEPHKTNLVVSAAEDKAGKIILAVADIIEFNPFWKKSFPNIVPIDGKWSTDGYWVIDKNYTREEWSGKMMGQIDPTFVGGGYESKKINGRHPSGVLLTDDIHDPNNNSDNERKFAVKFFTSILMKTVIRIEDKLDTWIVNIGVPYGIDDIHQTAKASGGFLHDSLPVMVRAKEGDKDAVYIDGVNEETGVIYEDIVGWWILTWGDKFGINTIKIERGYGKQDFWQQMMMDLTTARSGALKYYAYAEKDIDINWICSTGVDPSYTFKERKEVYTSSSFFSMCHVLKRPQGGAIVYGGELEKCSIQHSTGLLSSAMMFFTNHLGFFVEEVGIGKLYQETVKLINPSLGNRIIPSDLGGIRMKGEKRGKAKNKEDRVRIEIAPFLENGTIFISTAKTPFLNTLRDALDSISELDPRKPDPRWDALDSLYHAIKGLPDVLYQKTLDRDLSKLFNRQKAPHPLAGR